jgi:hypothetical protein
MLCEEIGVDYTSCMNESRFQVVDANRGDICHDAEWYLYNDLEGQKVGLINDTFIMKDFGMNIMAAVKTLEVEGGTIEPGYWYRFQDYVLRSNVRQANNYLGRRIHIPGITVIEKSRRMREWTRGFILQEEWLQMADKAAKELAQLAITEIEYPLPYPPKFPKS